jgi:hypothetical protein
LSGKIELIERRDDAQLAVGELADCDVIVGQCVEHVFRAVDDAREPGSAASRAREALAISRWRAARSWWCWRTRESSSPSQVETRVSGPGTNQRVDVWT